MNSLDVYFQTRLSHDPKRAVVWTEICRYLQRYVPVDGDVLDMGCGYGDFINHIQAARKEAVDLSESLAPYLSTDVTFRIQSCTEMRDRSDGQFNTVFASNLLEHLSPEQTRETLAEARRLLKPGGMLVLIQPNFKYCASDYFDDYTHVQIFTHVGLCDLLRSFGLEIVDCQPRFLPFSMKAHVPKTALLVRLYLHSPFRPMGAQMLVVARKPAQGHR